MENKSIMKTMEELICYWMEAVHLSNKLHDLSAYKEEATVMSLADTIENASSQVDNIRMDAQEKLKAVIDSAISTGTSDFGKYKDAKYQDKLDELMNMLYNQSGDINGYSREEQIDNFYDVLRTSLDELLVA